MTAAAPWFDVDRAGLAKLLERRGKAFVLYELLQNAWDTGAGKVTVTLEPVAGRPAALLVVEDDDPDGFHDLVHAYTLFAESEKKGDPTRRGRFNFGEKLVIAMCEHATVTSTTGSVAFDARGRHRGRKRREAGTRFEGLVRMSREEIAETLDEVRRALAPAGVETVINGVPLPTRTPLKVMFTSLMTEIADDGGLLRRRTRHTNVEIHARRPGEQATLYEMGIPVMDLGDDPWHVNVLQKIPLTMERDAAPPAYVRAVRTLVLEAMHAQLTETTARGRWAVEAIEACTDPAAVKALVTKRFGDKVVIADPSDREGENIAKAQGYTVIPGGAFTGEAWERIREAGAALPAGQVTPSQPHLREPLVHYERPTNAMEWFAVAARTFAAKVAGLGITVVFNDNPGVSSVATYTKTGSETGTVTFNVGRLGVAWFENAWKAAHFELLIHELGHHWGHHLETAYHDALCRLGGRATALALSDERFGR